MRRPLRISWAAVAITAAAVLTACGGATGQGVGADAKVEDGIHTDDISQGIEADSAAAKLVPADVRSTGKLVVAMDLSSPPTTFMAPDNKTPVGFNPDMARLIAKKLDLQLDIKNVKFDTIVPGLEGHRYDLTVSTMTPTKERLKVLDMIKYFKNGSSIVVPYGNPKKLAVDTLCGRNIGVQSGSVQELIRLPKLSKESCEAKGEPAIKGVSLPSVQDGLTQVASQRIDGVFYDTTSLIWAATQQPKTFEVLEPPAASSEVAVALGKGSKLTPAVQAAIQSIIDSPKYGEALGRWGFQGRGIEKATIAEAG
jgi:polar amino acid transport system substrate-binding protein